MSVSPEIKAAQEAYAARPFFAYVRSYGFSGGFRFHTFEEARAHLAHQIDRKGVCWSGSSSSLNQGVNLCSYVEGPDGKLDLEQLELVEIPQGPGCPLPMIVDQVALAAEKAAKAAAEASGRPLTKNQRDALAVLARHVGETVEVLTSTMTANVAPAAIRDSVGTVSSAALRGLEARGLIRIDLAYWKGARVTVLKGRA